MTEESVEVRLARLEERANNHDTNMRALQAKLDQLGNEIQKMQRIIWIAVGVSAAASNLLEMLIGM